MQTLSPIYRILSETFDTHDHQNALLILKYESFSRESGISEWWAGDEIPLGHKRDGEQVSKTLECSHDGWLLLKSEERYPSSRVFEGFKETDVHALNFARRRRNVQFPCTYLYQCLLFNLQKLKFVTLNKYILLENDFFSPKTFFKWEILTKINW